MVDQKQPMDKVYGEMIYSLLTEMNGSQSVQLRAVNNNIANNQRTMLALQGSIENLIVGLKETRDKRYQEEINNLETQMNNLRKQLEEKKIAKNTTSTTSEKIRAVSLDMIKDYEAAENKAKSINWIDVRNNTIKIVIASVVLVTVYYLLPLFGQLLQTMFTK